MLNFSKTLTLFLATLKKNLVLALSIIATSNVSAKMSPSEFGEFALAENAQLRVIQNSVHNQMGAMQLQAEDAKLEITQEFEEQKAKIHEEIKTIDSLRGPHDKEFDKWSDYALNQRKKVLSQLHSEYEDSKLGPLLAELDKNRLPVLDQIRQLNKEKNDIEQTHYANKIKYAGLMDGLDSLDAGLRMGFKDEEIKKLLASVDGYLPETISEIRRLLSKELNETLRKEEQKFKAMQNELSPVLAEFSQRTDVLYAKLRELGEASYQAVETAMPGREALFRQIEDQAVLAVISQEQM